MAGLFERWAKQFESRIGGAASELMDAMQKEAHSVPEPYQGRGKRLLELNDLLYPLSEKGAFLEETSCRKLIKLVADAPSEEREALQMTLLLSLFSGLEPRVRMHPKTAGALIVAVGGSESEGAEAALYALSRETKIDSQYLKTARDFFSKLDEEQATRMRSKLRHLLFDKHHKPKMSMPSDVERGLWSLSGT